MSDEKTVGEAANRLVDGIEALTRAAEKVAPQAWEAMVSAQRTMAIADIVIWLVVAAVGYVSARVFLWGLRHEDDKGAEIVVSGVIGAVSICVALISPVAVGSKTINCAINPEYCAATEVLGAIK